LADLIARTDSRDGFILMGHSLGARVIHSLLSVLSTTDRNCIKGVYLLGGAVDGTKEDTWGEIAQAVDGRIYNIYSTEDDVLDKLYRGANAFLSQPIGIRAIRSSEPNILNFDASTIVSGHMRHKKEFGQVLDRIFA
jgi:pimeloyl-ACP methyl ester carboxylesterase